MKTMNGNYIKLNRSILDWEWYDDINVARVFIHILLTANYKPKRWHGIQIERGQRVISISGLAEETGLTVRQVRTALDKLIATGELAKSATSRYTLITVENYNKFQDVKISSDKPSDKQQGKQATNKRQTNDNNIRREEGKERERGETPRTKNPYGRKKNVWLTDDEYQGIKERYRDYEKLIDHVGDYLANSKPYDDHEALINKIGREDKWIINIRSNTQELSPEEINRMRVEAFGEGWNT